MNEKKFNNAIEKADELAKKSAKNSAENLEKNEEKTSAQYLAESGEKNEKSAYKPVNGTSAQKGSESSRRKTSKKTADEKRAAAKEKSNKKDGLKDRKASAAAMKEEKKKAALIKRQEREEERAQRRIEAAKARQEKRENAKKAKLAKKQARERKRETIKELKLKKREERLARRDMLRHESAIDRRERKLAERQEKARLKSEKRAAKAELKAQKLKARQELARQKAEVKREKSKTRASRGIGGWLAAVISLGSCVLILATVLVWNVFMMNGGEDMLSGVYQQAFYDLVGYVDNIDVNLSKLSVTADEGQSQKLLNEVSVQANLAESDLAALPLAEESRTGTVKFVNQLGDFSKYLSNKLIDGESVTAEDKKTLAEFKRINASLKADLTELAGKIDKNYNFLSLLSAEEDNIVLQKFAELQSNSVDYPQMIYDGPFADRPEKSAADKPVGGEKITAEEAKNQFIKLFSDYSVTEAAVVGEAEGEGFCSYNIEGLAGGEQIFAQIACDGRLIDFNWYMDCSNVNYGRDECISVATETLQKWGYRSIKPVWTTQSGTTIYVNFAEEQNGIIVYADMIKVSVCMERGAVYAADFKAYIENHKERSIEDPAITVETAERSLSEELEIKTSRLCYIPLEGSGKERLAYEFWGESHGDEYYIYIDAINGKQLQIFKVVQTTEGTLLM